jgi:hypothetical protein
VGIVRRGSCIKGGVREVNRENWKPPVKFARPCLDVGPLERGMMSSFISLRTDTKHQSCL